MIGKTSILQNLKSLERLYNKSTGSKKAMFYSKLSILELRGWIEESMDDIVLRCANRNLKVRKNRDFVKDPIIERVYGFEYHKHFRAMLIRVVGLITLEKVEKRVDQTKFHLMKTSLGHLKDPRNLQAHTHLKGTTRRLDAPSVTISKFNEVYEGLKNFETELRHFK